MAKSGKIFPVRVQYTLSMEHINSAVSTLRHRLSNQEKKRTEHDAGLPSNPNKRIKLPKQPRSLLSDQLKLIAAQFSELAKSFSPPQGPTTAAWLTWFDQIFLNIDQLSWTLNCLLTGLGLAPRRILSGVLLTSEARIEISSEILQGNQGARAVTPEEAIAWNEAVDEPAACLLLFERYFLPLADFPVDGTIGLFKSRGLSIALLGLVETTRLMSAMLFKTHELLRVGPDGVDPSDLSPGFPRDAAGRFRFACHCGCPVFLPADYIGPGTCSYCACDAADHAERIYLE